MKRFDRLHKSKLKLLNVSVINNSWNRESRNNLKKTEKRGKERERKRERREIMIRKQEHIYINVHEQIERERDRGIENEEKTEVECRWIETKLNGKS